MKWFCFAVLAAWLAYALHVVPDAPAAYALWIVLWGVGEVYRG